MNNARGWHLIGFRSNHAEHLAKNLKAQVGLLYEANRIQYFFRSWNLYSVLYISRA